MVTGLVLGRRRRGAVPRRPLARLLAAAGYRVETACDGEAALAVLRAHRPACAVLDAMLAGRDGYDLCRAARCDPGARGHAHRADQPSGAGGRQGRRRARSAPTPC